MNSVINPLLYDDVVTNTITAPVRSMSTRISNSAMVQRFRQRANPAPAEVINLQRRGTDVGNTETTHITETVL